MPEQESIASGIPEHVEAPWSEILGDNGPAPQHLWGPLHYWAGILVARHLAPCASSYSRTRAAETDR